MSVQLDDRIKIVMDAPVSVVLKNEYRAAAVYPVRLDVDDLVAKRYQIPIILYDFPDVIRKIVCTLPDKHSLHIGFSIRHDNLHLAVPIIGIHSETKMFCHTCIQVDLSHI